MSELGDMVKALGLPAALVVFLIWWIYNNQKRDQQEKNSLAERLNKVEDYQKEKLETLVIGTQQSIHKSIMIQEKLVEVLNLRPCIHGKVKTGVD